MILGQKFNVFFLAFFAVDDDQNCKRIFLYALATHTPPNGPNIRICFCFYPVGPSSLGKKKPEKQKSNGSLTL